MRQIIAVVLILVSSILPATLGAPETVAWRIEATENTARLTLMVGDDSSGVIILQSGPTHAYSGVFTGLALTPSQLTACSRATQKGLSGPQLFGAIAESLALARPLPADGTREYRF